MEGRVWHQIVRKCALTLTAFDAVGHKLKKRVARLFVHVVQTFASIVAALCLPLEERRLDAKCLLLEPGFTEAEVLSIMSDGAAADEWMYTSDHLLAAVTGYQRDQ